ncbi:MAG: hypothetical protein H7Y20_01010, partial [Bryobacteraceae bacterium]|nr:hypothetical protein [Bryobacteraceae bacterium]
MTLLWPQVSMVPPGTNDTRVTEVTVPGGVTAAVGASVGGGVIAVPGGSTAPAMIGGGIGAIGARAISGNTIGASTAGGGTVGTVAGSGPATSGPAPGPALSGAAAGGLLPADEPDCKVQLKANQASIGPLGGLVDIPVVLAPAACRPLYGTSETWLQLASNAPAPNVFRFSAAPNLTAGSRTVSVMLGGQKFVVEQQGGTRILFAVAPGRLVFPVNKDYKVPAPKFFSLISEGKTIEYSVLSSAKWLKVEASKADSGNKAARFSVQVDPSRLARGRNQGYIHVRATGDVLSAPVTIPVIAELPYVR